eukprot:TRINITY_DN29883_c0_g1_i1.p1 TRINITY_DN29883_c0_g1~~TRINITY_DN29883_c0_g1_i1.p1  ORF type:complete len:503 (+),score=209.45 TRINITY_DN29883_c0_g1_i1:109-1617(+)
MTDTASPPKGGARRPDRPMSCPPMPPIANPHATSGELRESEEVRSESLDRLRGLKLKLQAEIAQAEKDKQATVQEVPLSLVEEYKDYRNRRAGKGAPPAGQMETRNKVAQQKGSGKQRELDIAREGQERELMTLRLHNQRLKNLIELRQQSSKRMEGRFEDEIALLKMKLDKTMTDKFDPKSSMKNLRDVNTLIQGKVSHLQRTIEMQAEIEKMNLVRQYRVKMHELKKELAEEKHSNYTGAQEWIDKNKVLQNELDEATETLDAITKSNGTLAMENKDLKVRYRQQEEERLAIVKRVTAMRREQGRLTEQVGILERECCTLAQTMPEEITSGDLQRTAGGMSGTAVRHEAVHTEAKYLEMINRLKRQLEHERRALKQVRSSHIALLQERTELEVFLRQCLQDVRSEIAATSHSYPVNLTRDTNNLPDYNAQHRDHLLELLLSKERVLSVLYSKTFPYKKPEESLAADIDPTILHDNLMSSPAEIDMDSLWKKWKSWTEKSM